MGGGSVSDPDRECRRLVVDSAFYNDSRDWDALAALYADDGVVVRPNGTRIVGRAAITESYAAAPANRRTRHVCTNWRFDLDGRHAARGVTSVLVYSWDADREPDPKFGHQLDSRMVIGDFADRFVRTPDGWRIAERRATLSAHT
jgi:ketosteroid isomerase-like protein